MIVGELAIIRDMPEQAQGSKLKGCVVRETTQGTRFVIVFLPCRGGIFSISSLSSKNKSYVHGEEQLLIVNLQCGADHDFLVGAGGPGTEARNPSDFPNTSIPGTSSCGRLYLACGRFCFQKVFVRVVV